MLLVVVNKSASTSFDSHVSLKVIVNNKFKTPELWGIKTKEVIMDKEYEDYSPFNTVNS